MYVNRKKKINKGAPSLFIIHSDRGISKEKEKEEGERQRAGLAPTPKKVANKFTAGLEDSDIVVATSSSGSQLQESFNDYSKHLVKSLPIDHDAAILVMDGHASRWTVTGLRYLLDHRIFPCFLPSHTSMWSQPNDCNVNRRLHECMEKAAQKYRRTDRAPTLAEYNEIMKLGWQLFIDEENTKLNSFAHNITSQAWEDCGLCPFNPFCINWNEAIAAFGQLDQEVQGAYEITPVERRDSTPDAETYDPEKVLTKEQKKTLREGIPAAKLKGMNDFEVASIRGREILLKWRNEIKEAVSEGETAENARTTIVPTGTTDPQKVAVLLVQFVPVDMSTIKTGHTLTKEERQKEADELTLSTTVVMQSVKLLHFDEQGNLQPAAAMRLQSLNEKGEQLWSVSINGGDPKQTPESDLLDPEKYQILSAYQDVADIGILRNGRARKQKRIRAEKAILSEKERSRKALEKQESAMYEDFNSINVAINQGKFDFVMMRTILLKWKKPFRCRVDDVECVVGQEESPILQMKPAMVKELTETVLAKRAKENEGDHISRPTKKRRNNAAVPTGFGEQGQTAAYLVQSRDFEEQKKKDAALLKSKQRRKNAVEKTLSEYNKFQRQLQIDNKAWRAEVERLVNSDDDLPDSTTTTNNNEPMAPRKKKKLVRRHELWEIGASTTIADLDILAQVLRVDEYRLAANKPTKLAWIPQEKLNSQDVERGYKSLQSELTELDTFLSKDETASEDVRAASDAI